MVDFFVGVDTDDLRDCGKDDNVNYRGALDVCICVYLILTLRLRYIEHAIYTSTASSTGLKYYIFSL